MCTQVITKPHDEAISMKHYNKLNVENDNVETGDNNQIKRHGHGAHRQTDLSTTIHNSIKLLLEHDHNNHHHLCDGNNDNSNNDSNKDNRNLNHHDFDHAVKDHQFTERTYHRNHLIHQTNHGMKLDNGKLIGNVMDFDNEFLMREHP